MRVHDSFEDDFSSEQIILFPLTEENMSPSYPDWLNDPQVNQFLLEIGHDNKEDVQSLYPRLPGKSRCTPSRTNIATGTSSSRRERKILYNSYRPQDSRNWLANRGEVTGEGSVVRLFRMPSSLRRLTLRKLTAEFWQQMSAYERSHMLGLQPSESVGASFC